MEIDKDIFFRSLYEQIVEHGIELLDDGLTVPLTEREARLKYGLPDYNQYVCFMFVCKSAHFCVFVTEKELTEAPNIKNYIWKFYSANLMYTKTFGDIQKYLK